MKIIEKHISPGDLKINPLMIATLMGIDEKPIPDPYQDMIDKEIELAGKYDDIRGGYKIIDDIELDHEDHIMFANKVRFSPGNQVTKYLKNSEKLAFFICTAGENVSKRSKDLMKEGNLLEGYVTDLVGSVLAEEAMEIIHRELSEEMSSLGFKTTNRYSPGYCDWNVDEQHQLFTLFPENFCSVRLSNSALMHPIKSVSGVIGLGKNVKFHKYVCHACSNVECIYRNLKYRVKAL